MAHSKSFQRRLVALAVSPIIGLPVHAATITTSTSCTLPAAIESANTDNLAGGCVAGDVAGGFGDDTIEVVAAASEINNVDGNGNALGVVSSNITINGNGNTVTIADGVMAAQFTTVFGASADLTIDNLTLDGSISPESGGAIRVLAGANLEVRDSVFSNNVSAKSGGAIYAYNSDLTISNTDFTQNVSQGASPQSGGAIALVFSTATITGGTLHQNSAVIGGGISAQGSQLTVDGSTLSRNRATDIGAGLSATDSMVTIQNATFERNSGNNKGAGIYVSSTSTLADSTHSLQVSNTTFNANTSFGNGRGAAIYIDNVDATITGGEITANRGRNGGGIDFDGADLRTLTIDGTTISRNTVTFDGGGLRIRNAKNTELRDTVVERNIAGSNYSGAGGGLHIDKSVVTISGSRIDLNRTNEEGGGIFLKSDVVLTVNDSGISGNTSTRNGAGIFSNGAGGVTVNLNKVGLIGNTSMVSGGGLYLSYSTLDVQRSTIANNMATSGGGGLGLLDVQFSMLASTVSNNNASHGAGIEALGINTTEIYNSTIVDNVSATVSMAGGLYLSEGATMENTVVANNGAIDCDSGTGSISGTNNWFGDASCNGAAQGDPDLADLPDFIQGTIGNTLARTPNESSGLIGAANTAFCSGIRFGTDQLGLVRKPRCDIGAVETEATGSFWVIPTRNGKTVIFEL